MKFFCSLVLFVFLFTGLPNTIFCKPNEGIDTANVTKPVSFAVLEVSRFDGQTLRKVVLTPGNVAVFRIEP
jgi:hypothetical protein